MRHALIDPMGNVVNVIKLAPGSKWTPPEGHRIVQDDDCQIGDTHDGTTFARINMMPEPIVEEPRPPTKLEELEARLVELEVKLQTR